MKKNDLLHIFVQECINGQTDGYEVVEAASELSKRYPEIIINWCDDHNHAMAAIILVPHEDEAGFHGTTFFYVPQCSVEKIASGYLYPNRLGPLADALKYHERKSPKN